MRFDKRFAVLALLATGAVSFGAIDADTRLADAVRPSLAVAEITLQPDNGEQPYGAGWGARCPNCGQVHNSRVGSFVEEERPMELPAFVVADDMVIVPDPLLHGRFIKSIAVRQGDVVVEASIERVFIDHRAVALKLAGKLPQAKPLAFDAPADATELRSVVFSEGNGRWDVSVSGYSPAITGTPDGPRINSVTKDSLLVTPDGKAAGLVFSESLPTDNSWRRSPLEWQSRTAADDAKLHESLDQAIRDRVVRVHLGFRSPKQNPNEQFRYGGNDENATDRQVHGVVIGENRVLVLAHLKPDTTARLERITVHGSADQGVSGKFLCSLKDYAAFVIETDQKLPNPVTVTPAAPDALVGPALVMAEVRIRGEDRSSYLSRARLNGLSRGWRKNLYPEMPLSGDAAKTAFLFDTEGRLVALPIMTRPKPKAGRDYGYESPKLTLASQLNSVLADPMVAADPNNIPLSEEDENRIAWLGVELQPLTPDLARLNNVAQQTNDGATGALVTFVYPDSPAAKAGIEVGAVLLRLQVQDQPQPLEITADEFAFAQQEFPWQHYDQFPEAYFDRIPTPWPTVATAFAKTLTEIGFGKEVTLELFQGGQVKKQAVTISQSPAYFDTAKRFKDPTTGLTVKAMTFELQRFFQLKPDSPGVIIAGIEPGSRGSKAGLKPYEYITHVNGQPVASADDFAKAVAAGGELRFDVVRMSKSRVVKIKLDSPKPDADAGAGEGAVDAAELPSTQPAD